MLRRRDPESLWADRDWRRYWTSRVVSYAGGTIIFVAAPILVYSLTGSALLTGVTTATEGLPYLLFGLLAGALSDRVGSALPAASGALVSAAACALLAAMPAGSGPLDVALRLALFGVGTGLFQSPNNSAVMGSAPRAHLGVVGSLLGTARTLGMVLGVAAAGAVLYAFVPASALRGGALDPATAGLFGAGVRHAYAAGAAFAAASALLALAGRRGRPGVG